MSSLCSRTGEDASIVAGIIAGRPWTAATVRNPHLRKHGRAFGRTFREARPVTDALRAPCLRLFETLARHSQLLERAHPLSAEMVPMLVRVAAYADRWLRPPETWQAPSRTTPDDQWRDFLRHLFVEWPLPAFFDAAWRVRGELRYLERDWFCHLARGGSWRKAGHFPPSITGRAIHFALEAPAHLTIRQALRRGQLAALGASEALVCEVLASAMVRDLSNDALWSRLFAKVATARDFDPREFGVLADALLDLLAHDHSRRALQLVELPLAELRRHCFRRWQTLLDHATNDGIRFRDRDLSRAGLRAELLHLTRATWEPMPHLGNFEKVCSEGSGVPSRWVIRERLSHAQLMAEGQVLRHCVAGYWRRCQTGRSAIFSLMQFHPAEVPVAIIPRLTIEVDRAARRIVQARGKWNRWPEEIEYRLLAEWAGHNSLQLAV